MDFKPISLIFSYSNIFFHLIAHLVHLSFAEGCFHHVLDLTPSFKKPHLDINRLSNFRSISNYNKISKILEQLFLTQIKKHITSSSNFNPYQSADQVGYFTETVTLLNIFSSIDNRKACLLVCLDFHAVFDTATSYYFIDSVKLQCLSDCLLTSAIDLSDKGKGTAQPDSSFCTDGVPQGSVLGPCYLQS